jgi:hypothetical protein
LNQKLPEYASEELPLEITFSVVVMEVVVVVAAVAVAVEVN